VAAVTFALDDSSTGSSTIPPSLEESDAFLSLPDLQQTMILKIKHDRAALSKQYQ
jgi:hypothetical protein